MLKKIIAIVLIVGLVCWLGALTLQLRDNVPQAQRMITEKIEEFKALGFDALAQEIGTGPVIEYVSIGSRAYPLTYTIERVPDTQNSSLQTLKIQGGIDCIWLLPFSGFRTGPTFEFLLSKDTSYQE